MYIEFKRYCGRICTSLIKFSSIAKVVYFRKGFGVITAEMDNQIYSKLNEWTYDDNNNLWSTMVISIALHEVSRRSAESPINQRNTIVCHNNTVWWLITCLYWANCCRKCCNKLFKKTVILDTILKKCHFRRHAGGWDGSARGGAWGGASSARRGLWRGGKCEAGLGRGVKCEAGLGKGPCFHAVTGQDRKRARGEKHRYWEGSNVPSWLERSFYINILFV